MPNTADFKLIKKNLKGITIVEVLISVTLAVMVITALMVLSAATTKINSSSLRRVQATRIATLALEAVRFYRDKESYNAFPSGTVCYTVPQDLLDPTKADVEALPGNANTPIVLTDCSTFADVQLEGASFQRKIQVNPEVSGSSSRRITVIVRWEESVGTNEGGTFYQQVALNTILGNW